MLVLTHASLATVDELFKYKNNGFKLEDFLGYTADQWGIKAHNRPWIDDNGQFAKGHKIIEVGGAYSLLPKYLSDKYDLEAWVADDFGMNSGEALWSRWGDPLELPKKYPSIKYVFERFGTFTPKCPDRYFDRIFTVSTLEHIPFQHRFNVIKDMHRCLKPGGKQLHTIDITYKSPEATLKYLLIYHIPSEIRHWIDVIKASGVNIKAALPDSLQLLDRRTLVESPDVVYRFYPPNDSPKGYYPSASLLLIIEDK